MFARFINCMVLFVGAFLLTNLLFLSLGSLVMASTGDGSFTTVVQAIAELVTNYKALGTLGVISSVVFVLVELLKISVIKDLFKSESSKLVKRLVVTVLSTALTTTTLMLAGTGIVESLIASLLTSGGAMAIYESIKALRSK
jgi:hypothetical protein